MLPTKYGMNFGPAFMNQAGVLLHIHTDGSIALHTGERSVPLGTVIGRRRRPVVQ